jgi:hypothetical protein
MGDTQLPAGNYAIVEILGHRTMIGRFCEVEQFGTKMLQIEPLFGGNLLEPVMVGGASIYQFTPCSAEVAAARAPKHDWQLPLSVQAIIPPELLPEPEPEAPMPIPDVPEGGWPDDHTGERGCLCIACIPF